VAARRSAATGRKPRRVLRLRQGFDGRVGVATEILNCGAFLVGRGGDSVGFALEGEGVAWAELGAFACIDLAVYRDLAVGDDEFGFAAAGDQSFEFQDLAEFDELGLDGDAFRRFGGHGFAV